MWWGPREIRRKIGLPKPNFLKSDLPKTDIFDTEIDLKLNHSSIIDGSTPTHDKGIVVKKSSNLVVKSAVKSFESRKGSQIGRNNVKNLSLLFDKKSAPADNIKIMSKEIPARSVELKINDPVVCRPTLETENLSRTKGTGKKERKKCETPRLKHKFRKNEKSTTPITYFFKKTDKTRHNSMCGESNTTEKI